MTTFIEDLKKICRGENPLAMDIAQLLVLAAGTEVRKEDFLSIVRKHNIDGEISNSKIDSAFDFICQTVTARGDDASRLGLERRKTSWGWHLKLDGLATASHSFASQSMAPDHTAVIKAYHQLGRELERFTNTTLTPTAVAH